MDFNDILDWLNDNKIVLIAGAVGVAFLMATLSKNLKMILSSSLLLLAVVTQQLAKMLKQLCRICLRILLDLNRKF